MVTALMLCPMEQPIVTLLCDNDIYLNLAVSYGADVPCTATATRIENDIVAIHSNSSSSLSLQGNRRVGRRILCGAFYIVGVRDGNLRSLTDEEVTKYSLRYREPEVFTHDELIEAWADSLQDGL